MAGSDHRLKKLIKALGLKFYVFAEEIGTSKNNLDKAFQEEDIRPSLIRPIKERFPQVSCEWLVTGSGSMFEEKGTRVFLPEGADYDAELKRNLEEALKRVDELNTTLDMILKRVNRKA